MKQKPTQEDVSQRSHNNHINNPNRTFSDINVNTKSNNDSSKTSNNVNELNGLRSTHVLTSLTNEQQLP